MVLIGTVGLGKSFKLIRPFRLNSGSGHMVCVYNVLTFSSSYKEEHVVYRALEEFKLKWRVHIPPTSNPSNLIAGCLVCYWYFSMETKEQEKVTGLDAGGVPNLDINEDGMVSSADYSRTSTTSHDAPGAGSSIAEFLARPILVSDPLWSTATAVNTDLFRYNIGAALNTFTLWTNKIAGYRLIRGTAVFRIMINASPFQQGKLYFWFVPALPDVTLSCGDANIMRTTMLSSVRQLPGVELDCRESSCIIRIPYVAPSNWFDIKTASYYDWGTFGMRVLSPLASGTGGSTSVQVSLYMSFEDFEVAAPTVPQGPSGGKKKYSIRKLNREEAAMEAGPVQRGLSTTSKIAGSLGDIPFIGDFANTLSWAANIASGVAGAFGWSKPLLTAAPTIMTNQYNRYMAVPDGLDVSIPLSLSVNHETKVTDTMSIRSEDEMSFSFLKAVPTIINSIAWSAATPGDTSLYGNNIGPSVLYESLSLVHNSHTTVVHSGPPVFYLSNSFELYRGSLVLTLKFVKTDYHSGRLSITWTPGVIVGTTPTLSNSGYAIREIVDLRVSNEVCLTLPYLLPTNYNPVLNGMGYLDIRILNELIAPPTVAQSIQMLMYWNAGPDFEFQLPTTFNINAQPIMPQMNDDIGDEVIKCGNIGGVNVPNLGLEFAEESIGEMFSSVKQLTSRFNQVYSSVVTTNTNTLGYYPWHVSNIYMVPATGVLASCGVGGDMFSTVACMYAYMRGNMRVVLQPSLVSGGIPTTLNNIPFSVVNNPYPNNAGLNILGTSLVTAGTLGHGTLAWELPTAIPLKNIGVAVTNPGNGLLAVEVPYYTAYKFSAIVPTSNSVLVTSDPSRCLSYMSVYTPTASLADFSLYRATGDDFQFAYFLGAPPVTYSYI